MRAADCSTDHLLLRTTLKTQIQLPHQLQARRSSKKLAIDKLKLACTRAQLQQAIENALSDLDTDTSASADTQWSAFRSTIFHAAEDVLGHPKRNCADWFQANDEAIERLIANSRLALQERLRFPNDSAAVMRHQRAKSALRTQLRQMENKWWLDKAAELQAYADSGNTRAVFQALKTVYGPKSSSSCPILASDGEELLTAKQDILSRWREHFSNLLNRQSTVDESIVDTIPQRLARNELDLPPSFSEVRLAVGTLNNNKAAGNDGIPAEVYKYGGESILRTLCDILQSCWTQGSLPQDFKDATIVTLYKRKGDRHDCGNYRGISLLSIAGKVLAKVLLKRLMAIANEVLPESQCGFRANRSTVDMIFTVRQLQEKSLEQQMPLYLAFIDFSKAFDTVHRDCVWQLLHKYGCPPKFVGMIQQLHDGMQAQVCVNGDVTDPFPVAHGVKQGCVLAPTLFTIYLAAVLTVVNRGLNGGVHIVSRTDRKLFDAAKLKARTKVMNLTVNEVLYADDTAFASHSAEGLQHSLDCFANVSAAFGLTINTKKTEVLFQPVAGASYTEPDIRLNGSRLKVVPSFTYLGSTVSNDCTLDKELTARIQSAWAAFGRLRKRLWDRHGVRTSTKCKVYRAAVMPCLLYSSETYTLYLRHIRRLSQTHMRQLRCILHIKWQDRITNNEVLKRANMPSLESILRRRQLTWIGHVMRMDNNRIPKFVSYGQLAEGQRKKGRPKLRYLDCIKRHLKAANIDLAIWDQLTQDRNAWRRDVKDGVAHAECTRIAADNARRQTRHAAAANSAAGNTVGEFVCAFCGRHCRARIGLVSHERACSRNQVRAVLNAR